jgi:hypothetical protein
MYRTDIIKLTNNHTRIERGSAEIDNQRGFTGSGLKLGRDGRTPPAVIPA